MNSVNLIGNLTRPVDTRATNYGDSTIGKLRIAIDRPGREGADYVDVVTFGRLAEACGENLAKGSRVGVTGRLAHSEWTGADGARRQSLEVIASSVDFLSPRPSSDWHDQIPEPNADFGPTAPNTDAIPAF